MGASSWIRPLLYYEGAEGQAWESCQRIIRPPPADHYRLEEWALCPYLAEQEVRDEYVLVYFRSSILLSEFTGGRSLAADG